jgi:hypothetical protein
VLVNVEIGRDSDGRVVGEVAAPAGAAQRFTGWLELLHLLEDHADDTTPQRQGSEQ